MTDGTDVRALVMADLAEEGAALERLLVDLDGQGWTTPTPAEGWTVAHQVGHLTWTDEQALLAAIAPDAFAQETEQLLAHDGTAAVDRIAQERAELGGETLLAGWRTGREALADALESVDDGVRLPWYGPPMSVTSMATARLMETWAHGQDIVDALGVERDVTDRLRHVAHLAVRTRDFAHHINDLEPPSEPIRVEISAPGEQTWTWGPQDAEQRVTGTARGFCLLAVQRRHRDDVEVTAHGEQADRWLDVIQAFAGPPGPGREPGTVHSPGA